MDMDQTTLGFEPLHKKTRKEIFLEEMERVVPWAELVALIASHARGAHQALGGRPPFAVETMLRIHCLQLWWNLSDPGVEEELHERPLYRQFAGLGGAARLPDEATILRFRHLLEKHQLAPQVLRIINEGLSGKACCSRPAPWSMPASLLPPAPPRTARESVILRCIRPRRAISGTSA